MLGTMKNLMSKSGESHTHHVSLEKQSRCVESSCNKWKLKNDLGVLNVTSQSLAIRWKLG